MNDILCVFFSIIFLFGNLGFVQAYIKTEKAEMKKICQKKIIDTGLSIIKVPTESEIVEFSINLAGIILGAGELPEKLSFKWEVKPGAEKKTKTKINIRKTQGLGPAIDFSSPEITGSYSVDIPKDTPEGKTTYTLTVTNEQYSTNMASVVFEAKSLQFALDDIEVNGLNIGDISGSVPENTAFDLFISVANRSNIDLPSMRLKALICKMGGSCIDNPLSYGEIPITIFKGHRNYRIPLKFIPATGVTWSSIRIKLLDGQKNILLKIWEFPVRSEEKKVYSLM